MRLSGFIKLCVGSEVSANTCQVTLNIGVVFFLTVIFEAPLTNKCCSADNTVMVVIVASPTTPLCWDTRSSSASYTAPDSILVIAAVRPGSWPLRVIKCRGHPVPRQPSSKVLALPLRCFGWSAIEHADECSGATSVAAFNCDCSDLVEPWSKW